MQYDPNRMEVWPFDLANAVIKQAVEDYQDAYLGKYVAERSPKSMMIDCERFFQSTYFSTLTDVSSIYIMEKAKEMALKGIVDIYDEALGYGEGGTSLKIWTKRRSKGRFELKLEIPRKFKDVKMFDIYDEAVKNGGVDTAFKIWTRQRGKVHGEPYYEVRLDIPPRFQGEWMETLVSQKNRVMTALENGETDIPIKSEWMNLIEKQRKDIKDLIEYNRKEAAQRYGNIWRDPTRKATQKARKAEESRVYNSAY